MKNYEGFTPPKREVFEGTLHVKAMWKRGRRLPPNCYIVTSDGMLLALRGAAADALNPESNGKAVRASGNVVRHLGSPETHAIMADFEVEYLPEGAPRP